MNCYRYEVSDRGAAGIATALMRPWTGDGRRQGFSHRQEQDRKVSLMIFFLFIFWYFGSLYPMQIRFKTVFKSCFFVDFVKNLKPEFFCVNANTKDEITVPVLKNPDPT